MSQGAPGGREELLAGGGQGSQCPCSSLWWGPETQSNPAGTYATVCLLEATAGVGTLPRLGTKGKLRGQSTVPSEGAFWRPYSTRN